MAIKRLLLAAVAGLALTSAARAADLYPPGPLAPAPPVVPPPIPTWTGFYVGFNAGLAADRFELPYQVGTASGNASLNIDRGIGGVQVGYNWQFSPRWLVGLEADFDGSDIEDVRDHTTVLVGFGSMTAGTNLDRRGTVRARLGFAVTPSAILYVTGGGAYGGTSSTVTSVGTFPVVAASFTNDEFGWASGGGLEYALTDQLSFKTEYIYLDLGSGGSGTFSSPGFSIHSSINAHTLKAGLNFKLSPWGLR